VSRLHHDAANPRDELRIALAGPLVSVGIALTAGGLAGAVFALDGPDLLVASLGWLALINGLLAVFNLVPAAPLDGGRVLHAIVWRRCGDRAHATTVATKAGRAFGYGLITVGVLTLAAGDLGGLWFTFLGWFLLTAARAEATHLLLSEALAGVKVRDVMTADPVTISDNTPVSEALDVHMMRERCSALPVVGPQGDVTGLLSLRDVRATAPERRGSLLAREVARAIDDVPRAAPDEPVMALFERLPSGPSQETRTLVFDGDRLVGIVSPTDLNRAVELAMAGAR
jgi:CBS domain-containing protein